MNHSLTHLFFLTKKAMITLLILPLSLALNAQVKLPSLIGDGMILQRDTKLNIWGWAGKGEKVTVKFKNKSYKSVTNAAGKWQVSLPPMPAGGPFTMEVLGKSRIEVKDILIGDVWFCSGQSNMVHQLNIHDVTYAKVIAEANDPQIRQFWIPTLTHLQGPQNDVPNGRWKAAVGEDIRPFSAVAYFFAKQIHEKYKVPVGIINASVGGTPIEAWIGEEGFQEFPDLRALIQKNKDTAYVNSFNHNRPVANSPQPEDAGLTGNPKWYDVNYTPKGWRTINIPGYWEDQGIKDLNGVMWYRKEIDIPASMTGKAARVFLGRIVDADELYINGKQVGKTAYMYPQRRYYIPSDLLKAGKNVFVIRVTNNAGKGGFVPDKPYCIFAGKDTVDLKGYWQYKVGAVFQPRIVTNAVAAFAAHNQPAALYNAMVAPEINYAIKGICWYQGEANAGRPEEYAKLLPALIQNWRKKWGQDSLPFLYVQLPGFMDYNYLPSESNWALLRESQLKSLSVPNTAMTVAIDLGEWNDIHPDNKKDVGERLALAAEKLAYHENIEYSGPVYQSFQIEENKIRISFTNVGSGLATSDGEELASFAIAGSDKKFVWAKAKIEGEKVVVWNDEVALPKYVRYAWADNPVNPNLINKAKLPASPFRTDHP
jgi:sialate O-acetylesterase